MSAETLKEIASTLESYSYVDPESGRRGWTDLDKARDALRGHIQTHPEDRGAAIDHFVKLGKG